MSVTEYLSIFQKNKQAAVQLLSGEFKKHGRYSSIQNPVATTWLVSFKQIRSRNALAIDFLSFMSYINPKEIPQSLLPLAQSAKTNIKAIGMLHAYSFVTKRSVGGFLNLHRLVHLSTRSWLIKEGLLTHWVDRTISRLEAIMPVDVKTDMNIWRVYLPHVHDALELTMVNGGTNECSNLYYEYGRCQTAEGKYEEAEECFRRAIELDTTTLGVEHPRTLSVMNDITLAITEQGR